jgi:serine/threonine protein kinase
VSGVRPQRLDDYELVEQVPVQADRLYEWWIARRLRERRPPPVGGSPYRTPGVRIELGRSVIIRRFHRAAAADEAIRLKLAADPFPKIFTWLRHRNLIEVHSWHDPLHRRPYLVMERLRGWWLRTALERGGDPGLELPVCVEIARQLGQALAYLHGFERPAGRSLELVHRSVDPAHVLLCEGGLVKLLEPVLFQPTEELEISPQVGRFCYMSPEQVKGERVGPRSDVFALATLLYELITGRQPFTRSSGLKTVWAVHRAEVPPPSKLRGEVPAALEALVLSGLCREEEERMDAASFCRGLEGVAREQGWDEELVLSALSGLEDRLGDRDLR